MTNESITALSCQFDVIKTSGVRINNVSAINESLSVHYLVYRIDNYFNGKHYIGQHMTRNPFDSYMGSGKIIRRAIKHDGLSSFVKTILFDFATFEEMDTKERELVQLSNCFPYDPDSYNIIEGGAYQCARKGPANGMFGKNIKDYMTAENYELWHQHITDRNREIASRPGRSEKMSSVTAGEKNPMFGHACTEFMDDASIERWHENLSKANSGENNPMFGKNSWANWTGEKREDRKRRFSQSMKGKNKGKRMMQLPGTNEVKFVHPNDIQSYLDKGYLFSDSKGRKRMEIAQMNPLA